jgi:hypothetical protein
VKLWLYVLKPSSKQTAAGSPRSSICQGVMVYGVDRESAIKAAKELARRVIAERIEHGEPARPGEEKKNRERTKL